MATTQAGRQLSVTTPLGEDFLLIKRFRGYEGLSKLFTLELELLHEENDESYEPTLVEPQRILGQNISLKIKQKDGTTRTFSGICNHFQQGNRDTRFSYYRATVVPKVWTLTQKFQSRIFQRLTVPDILKKVFQGFDVKYEFQGKYEQRNYCVQYQESDFDFASRLMEEEGIYYYFEHSGGNHTMIVADSPQSHRDCPSKPTIACFLDITDQEEFISSISTWRIDHHLQSGKFTLWDNNFQLPNNKLDAEQPSRFNIGGNQKLEIYEYQGGYARKYDGIDKSGGDQSGELQKVFEDKKQTAKVRMEQFDSQYKTVNALGNCCSLTGGHRFTLTNHPNASQNAQHIVVSIEHQGDQSPEYIFDDEVEIAYINEFSCMPHGAGNAPFRPPRKTAKPIVRGSQTAMVVGPAGEEIFTDKFSRVKVQFNWDREGKHDINSSCWIRVSTLWAGKQWGVIHIPRIGQEVIVDFIEGDPDQPIITGSIYNPQTMPPYKLPDNKTQSGIQSRSTKGGSAANFNEFRFEDKMGSEEIYLHAEKDWTIMVEHDKNQTVGHDETHHVVHDRTKNVDNDEKSTITHNRTEEVGSGSDKEKITIHGFREETVDRDETITITENRTEKVGKNETITIGKDRKRDVIGSHTTSVKGDETNSVTGKRTDNVAKSYELKVTDEINGSAKTIKIQAGMELILSGPGGQIKIDGTGVTITGVLVKIN